LPVFRPRRALAVAGLVSLGTGLLMLTSAGGAAASASSPAAGTSRAAAQYPAAAHSSTGGKLSRAVGRQFAAQVKQQTALSNADSVTHSPITKTGPHMWDPSLNGGKGGQNPKASTVTVSETTSLVDQQIQVSWTNFTPSSSLTYQPPNVDYAVMLAQCKGTNPTSPADCYSAETDVTSNSGSASPPNTSFAVTGPDGSGTADIRLLVTKAENPFLGCDQSHPCSLLVEPAQGGNANFNPPHCKDHSQDVGFGGSGSASAGVVFNTHPDDYYCSWAKRIVVPLTFARSAATCPFKNSAFSVEGSPMMARAVDSWKAALCVGSRGLSFDYNSEVAETQAVTDTGGGAADVALTTRSASSQQISTGRKHFVYAPVGVSAVSVAYWFDNAVTGLPVTNIRLNQRLLLKLLTQSYAFGNDGCPPVVEGAPCDNAVDHNPITLFSDPDFLQLNPEYASQDNQPPLVTPPASSSILLPIVQQGLSDMTWTVTNWIAANKDAKQFLTGQFDPGGMHLNTWYNGLQYPTDQFVGQDTFPLTQLGFAPVFPLGVAVTHMVQNWPTGLDFFKTTVPPAPPGFLPFDVESPGTRTLMGIIDQADSAAYLFPAAQLSNATGRYMAPTKAHMLAALQHMTGDGGTKLVDPNSTTKNAYPLTMVIYAMVPTSGTSHAKAAAIARFLDFAAGAGQKSGVQPGQLPPGYAPLPASMRAQTRKDALAVLHQTGASAPQNNNRGNNNSGSSSRSKSGKGSGSGSASSPTTPSPGATGNPISLVNVADAHTASITRYILPALLILGGLAALAGSSSLIGSSSTPISARLRRIGQAPLTWSRAARTRLGLRRSK